MLEYIGNTNLGDILPFLHWVDFQGLEKRFVNLMKKLDKFMQKLVHEQRKLFLSEKLWESHGQSKKTVIDHLLSLQHKEPKYYMNELIEGIILAMLGAETESSTTTLEWTMSVLNHPESMDKALAEIQTCYGRALDKQDLPTLKYVQRNQSNTRVISIGSPSHATRIIG
ncbi:unnamed protein product [Fraxinus pennsylvanica]|uniref:Cytochrome P450 n=1 Tax=Fraxinus pennsylvanica TaxID=56036 RepID=A0AAD1Z4Y9_9LAMI|nr:unnamed protein product [Fraxinus pennsylvanica]